MEISKSLKVSVTALFAAFAAILEILPLDLRFPLYEKLTLDPTGIPLALALYMFGIDVASIATIIAIIWRLRSSRLSFGIRGVSIKSSPTPTPHSKAFSIIHSIYWYGVGFPS